MGQVTGFAEVADRVWVARHDWFDVNVTAIEGEHGLVVVDTNASDATARATLAALRQVSTAPLLAAVNTHVHFDHTFGNAVFAADGAELIAHEAAALALPAHDARIRAQIRREAAAETDPRFEDWDRTVLAVPGRTFSSALTIDLGDRQVELIHPGRGHTDGDLVVRVPGAGGTAAVLLAGDLVETAPAGAGADRVAVPGLGDDCFPMEWPLSLDLVISLIGEETVVVPGHGPCTGKDFVWEQRAALGVVAETIRDLAGRGVGVEDALDAAPWPYPRESLTHAVRRGYEHLPRAQKRLPLL